MQGAEYEELVLARVLVGVRQDMVLVDLGGLHLPEAQVELEELAVV